MQTWTASEIPRVGKLITDQPAESMVLWKLEEFLDIAFSVHAWPRRDSAEALTIEDVLSADLIACNRLWVNPSLPTRVIARPARLFLPLPILAPPTAPPAPPTPPP